MIGKLVLYHSQRSRLQYLNNGFHVMLQLPEDTRNGKRLNLLIQYNITNFVYQNIRRFDSAKINYSSTKVNNTQTNSIFVSSSPSIRSREEGLEVQHSANASKLSKHSTDDETKFKVHHIPIMLVKLRINAVFFLERLSNFTIKQNLHKTYMNTQKLTNTNFSSISLIKNI